MEVNHLSTAFRAARKSKKLTQIELAEKVGCSKVTIQRLEGGTEWTGADIHVRVSRALEMRLSSIIRYAEESSPE